MKPITDVRLQTEEQLLVDSMPLGVLSMDLEGKIRYANPALLSLLDLSSPGVLHELDVLNFPPLIRAGFDGAVRRCLDSRDIVISECTYTSEEGKVSYLRLYLTPVFDETQQIVTVQVVVEDISEHRDTEELLWQYQRRLEDQNAELNKLSQAIEQSANIVVITDLSGTIQYVNPKFVEATGYASEEALGQNPRILKSGRQDDQFYRELWETITSGKQWRGDFHNRRKDGTLYWEQASIAPIYDPAGRMTHFIAIKEDVTDRKRAEESLNRYTERLQILHEIDQLVLAAQHPDTIAIAAIHRIRRLIPCQRVTVLARGEDGEISMLAAASDDEISSIDDVSAYQEMFDKPPLGSGFVQGCGDLSAFAELTALQKSLYEAGMRSYVAVPLFIQEELVGTLNMESTQPKAFTPGHITIAVQVAASLAVAIRQARLFAQAQQEIAARKRAQRALGRYNVELEERNAELDAFAHTVAHDLKNPVTAIVGYADVLKKNLRTLPDEVLTEFLTVLARNSHKMAAIIDELLLLASVRGVQEVELQPLEMGRVVAEARGRLLYLIEEHQGEISLPDSWPVALGYGPWVEAVWTNYLSNALKYGGRPPKVTLGATDMGNGWIRFWVSDNGPGLSQEEQARLFVPFERLHQGRSEGHGLGLSIVQRIVKKLGGQVGVESTGEAEDGCEFYFTLPALPITSDRPHD